MLIVIIVVLQENKKLQFVKLSHGFLIGLNAHVVKIKK